MSGKKVYGGPEQVKFTTPGQKLENVILEGIDTITIEGKPVKRYSLYSATDERDYFVLGNVDLDNKIRPRFVGREIDIKYVGMQSLPGGSEMKHFEVAYQ